MIANLEELIDALSETTREYVGKQLAEIRAQHALEIADLRARLSAWPTSEDVEKSIERRFAEQPKPENGKNAVVDYDKIGDIIAVAVEKEVGKYPVPKNGEPGKDATQVDYGHIGEIIKAAAITAVADQIRAMPVPVAPEPKSVDYERVSSMVDAAVIREVGRLPTPEPTQIDPAAIAGAVTKALSDLPFVTAEQVTHEVDRAIAAIPKNEPIALPDVPSIAEIETIAERVATKRFEAIPSIPDAVELDTLISANVEERFALAKAIPAAPTVDVDMIRAEIEQAVGVAVKALPPVPTPVVDQEMVRTEVARQIAGIELPEPKEIDASTLSALIVTEVGRQFAEQPKPENGTSVTVDDVRPIIEQAVAARVAEIPVPKNGESVHPDTVALMVREAVDKAIAGIKLPEDGKPGRDALDLEVLDGIDPEKSYPAGTFALHDGGMVLATRQTDPIGDDLEASGWKVTQDGIKGFVGEPDDSNDLKHIITVIRTSGKRDRLEFVTSFANMDKGVYRPGMKYKAGSAVTFDESYWVARCDTQSSPPGPDWRLILKGKRRP